MNNPGLAEFDLSKYTGIQNQNFYHLDRPFQTILEFYATNYEANHKQAMFSHIGGYGALVGGILNELTIACHKEGKYGELVSYDRFGNRIDQIVYAKEQLESRKISYEYGIVNLDSHPNWKHPFTNLHKYSLAYLANMNGEGGVTCPLAMTDGLIKALHAIGTPEQKNIFLPILTAPDSKSHFMAGQYVTERVGGSNVGANRTVATQKGNGNWVLNGEKWFCSNPGDVWVTTARVEGTNTIGMFLVSRVRKDGTLNGCILKRKKEIIGSRGKLTVESVYEDCEATELGRVTHGLSNLIHYIIQTSRIHVSIAELGISKRAILEAKAYVSVRTAYSKKVQEYKIIQKALAEMNLIHLGMSVLVFKVISILDSQDKFMDLINPLLKYSTTVRTTWIVQQAILLHGGNGILSDFSVLPRLLNDSIINETWEGTHMVVSEHVLKAFFRPKIQKRFFEEIQIPDDVVAKRYQGTSAENLHSVLQKELEEWMEKDMDVLSQYRLEFCNVLYELLAISELMRFCFAVESFHEFAIGYADHIFQKRNDFSKPNLFQESGSLEKLAFV